MNARRPCLKVRPASPRPPPPARRGTVDFYFRRSGIGVRASRALCPHYQSFAAAAAAPPRERSR